MSKVVDRQASRLRRCLKKHAADAAIPGLKLVQGQILQRIHNRGEATNGSKIGDYLSSWRDVRLAAGYQVSYVDLQWEGDLFRSVVVGTSNGVPVLGFSSDRERYKAVRHELFRKKSIWKPSKKERQALNKAYGRELGNRLRKCL